MWNGNNNLFIGDTNFVFMFAPSEKTEILIQQNDNVSLYELVMGPEEPTVNFIW